jgi:hypothetical protein
MRRALPLLLVLGALLLWAAPAEAAFGLHGFDVTFAEEGGAPATAAGTHPGQIETTFHVNFHEEEGGETSPDEELKELEVSLPVGFAGNPTATPRCSREDFAQRDPITTIAGVCPAASAIGIAHPEANHPGKNPIAAPVYNLAHPPGVAAQIGFYAENIVPVVLDIEVSRTAPYRVVAVSANTPQPLKVYGAEITIWGNPENPSHDEERGTCAIELGKSCPAEGAPEKPFLTMPRACASPLFASYAALSWQSPHAAPTTGTSESPLAVTGCEALEFHPEVKAAAPTTSAAESASGLDFELSVDDPGLSEIGGTADADIRQIKTVLPPGVTVNPSAGEGQAACSAAQLAAETLVGDAGCPGASKLGSVEVETPLLEGQKIGGSVYLAAQGDNPFGSLLAFYIVLKDPEDGILVEQPARVDLDPVTGQITTTVSELPELPFSHLRLQIRGGERAPLVSPRLCGAYQTETTLTPYTGAPAVAASSAWTVSSGISGAPCPPDSPRPLAAGFSAGTLANGASAYSPYELRFTRGDGEAEITRLAATLPAGIVPKLAGVAKCTPAEIAAARTKTGRAELAQPSCPASSLIGHLQSGAGVGPALTYVPGSVYLAGPYNGDPLSAVAIVPALAGPLDLGTVVNQVGLTLNPATHLGEIESSASEPFPRILDGIPLRLRDLQIDTDRPQFTLNATGCEPEATTATLFAAALPSLLSPSDLAANLTAPYQARGCGSLGFNPKLSLSLSGQTKRSGHPQLRSVVTYPYPSGPGYSNIGKAVVTLPPSEFIDQSHINNPCTRVQFAADQCPASSILGHARAFSPLLEEPLEGPVYFRSNGGERELPDIVADLHGLVNIELVGYVDAKVRGEVSRIRTTFAGVPDAPVKKFILELKGGKKHGLLENSRDLCGSAHTANLKLVAQSGRVRESTPQVKTSCGGKGKGKKGGGGRGGKQGSS